MPSYTLGELIEIMEPQAEKDREGITSLIREIDSAWELPYISLSPVFKKLDEQIQWLEQSARQKNDSHEMKM